MFKVGPTLSHFAKMALPRATRATNPIFRIAERAFSSQMQPRNYFNDYKSGHLKFSESVNLEIRNNFGQMFKGPLDSLESFYAEHNRNTVQGEKALIELVRHGKISPEKALFTAFKRYCEHEEYLTDPYSTVEHPTENLPGLFALDKKEFLKEITYTASLSGLRTAQTSFQKNHFSPDELSYLHQKGVPGMEYLLRSCRLQTIGKAEESFDRSFALSRHPRKSIKIQTIDVRKAADEKESQKQMHNQRIALGVLAVFSGFACMEAHKLVYSVN